MPSEVSTGSPIVDSSFADNVAKTESPNNGGGKLDGILEFNTTFDQGGTNATVDPRLAFCNTPTPNHGQYNAASCASNAVLDQTRNTEPSAFNTYLPDFGSQAPSPPYFRSIENSPAPAYHASPLHYTYRRSISEPPGAPTLPQQAAQAMILHRENHYLGKPISQQPMPLKSLPKHKRLRPHPYSRNMEQQPQQHRNFRPEHRRAHTQPVQVGPTSAPYYPMPPQYFLPPMAHESQFSSARLCTPAADGVVVSSPADPMLNNVQAQTPQPMGGGPKSVLSIPLTVDELGVLIFDAVQKAMCGAKTNEDAESGEVDSCDAKGNAALSQVEEGASDATRPIQ